MIDSLRLRFSARVGLLLGLRREYLVGWSDFRKFTAESTFSVAEPAGESDPPR